MTDTEIMRLVLTTAAVIAGRGQLWHPQDHCALCGVSVSEPQLQHERRHGEQYALPILRAKDGLRGAALALAVGERYRELLRVQHADVTLEHARQTRIAAETTLDMARALDRGVGRIRAEADEALAAKIALEEQLERERGAVGAALLRLSAGPAPESADLSPSRDRFELIETE